MKDFKWAVGRSVRVHTRDAVLDGTLAKADRNSVVLDQVSFPMSGSAPQVAAGQFIVPDQQVQFVQVT